MSSLYKNPRKWTMYEKRDPEPHSNGRRYFTRFISHNEPTDPDYRQVLFFNADIHPLQSTYVWLIIENPSKLGNTPSTPITGRIDTALPGNFIQIVNYMYDKYGDGWEKTYDVLPIDVKH